MFDPVRICAILNEEGVEYVIVGGFAAVIRGSSLPTRDIDVVPSRATDNLERLGRALKRLGAKIRTGDEPVAAPLDGQFLANTTSMLNLVTDLGDVDLAFAPAGRARDYAAWRRDATEEELSDGVFVLVADLDDVIDSKRAAGRPKDRMALPYLEALRDELGDA